MKVLVLNGSPHREKSTTMCAANAFVNGMCSAAECDVEFVNISDLNVKPCLGCLSCWGFTEGECVIKNDDVRPLKEKILASDIIIESFPLYFFGMPGTVKTLTDRLLSMFKTYEGQSAPRNGSSAHGLRYYNEKQKFVLISSCAYTETEEIYDSLTKQFDLICGRGRYTSLFFPQLKTLSDKGGSRKERFEARVFAAGAEFAREGSLSEETIKKITKPPFTKEIYEVIIRNVFDDARKEGQSCQR